MRRLIALAFFILSALYPFAIYWMQGNVSVNAMAALVCMILVARAFFLGWRTAQSRLLFLFALFLAVTVFGLGHADALRWYPVMVNLGFLTLFAYSLLYPPTVIERLARLKHSDLPESGVRYTRRVTQIWCVFFVFNSLISVWTIVCGDLRIWTLYNGLLAYFLMGILFLGELLCRPDFRKRFQE